MSLKNLWCGKMSLRGGVAVAAVSGLLLLAACGGDSGTSAPSDDGTSDSEEIQSSSSTPKVESSSSSKGEAKSSSSNQSSSSNEEIDDGWSWDVPKEAFLNTEITYDSITDPRDGQIYKTVKIGNQVWMAENLNYSDSVKTPSLLERSWCYDNKAENCAVAGRLYTWAAVIDSVKLATDADNPQDCGLDKNCTLPDTVQGICPPGWHLPNKTEWERLFAPMGGSSTAGKVLKSQTGWVLNGNGTDYVGFSVLPAGGYASGFYGAGGNALFWSSSESEYNNFGVYCLGLDLNSAGLIYEVKNNAISVRCLKDL